MVGKREKMNEILNKNQFKSGETIKNKNQEEKLPFDNLIKNFEKNMVKNFEYNYDKLNDSDYEEEFLNEEINLISDKTEIIKRYKLIQENLKDKIQQVKVLQKSLEESKKKNSDFMSLISKDTSIELKDKKLIELVKKNQDLNLKLEKYRLKEKELENKINELQTGVTNTQNESVPKIGKKDSNTNVNSNMNSNEINMEEELNDFKKRLKNSEAKIVKIRYELQIAKEENTKLNILIKREIGDSIDIEKALRDKTYWKGRSEIIESLKTKIKILENQIEKTTQSFINSNTANYSLATNIAVNNPNISIENSEDDRRSSVSAIKSIIPTTCNFVPFVEYKKEKEAFKTEIDKLKEENMKLSNEYSRVKSRTAVLEKELKQQKEDLTSKLKILIEKSDNDEKLINALHKEIEKRGIRLPSSNYTGADSVFNLQQEIVKLRGQLREKENIITNLNSTINSNNSNNSSDNKWNAENLAKIIARLKEVEDENKELKKETDEGKLYEALAKENAKLRLKIRELEDK